MKLRNKTVLITGGTSGIGRELACQLLERGNTVVITGRDIDKMEATKRALPAVHGFQSDVSDPIAITALHRRVVAEFPLLDVLINNAGIMRNLNFEPGTVNCRARLISSATKLPSASRSLPAEAHRAGPTFARLSVRR